MTRRKWGRFPINGSANESNDKIRHLEFEGERALTGALSKLFYAARTVDDMKPCIKQAQQVVLGLRGRRRPAFVMMDALMERHKEKASKPN